MSLEESAGLNYLKSKKTSPLKQSSRDLDHAATIEVELDSIQRKPPLKRAVDLDGTALEDTLIKKTKTQEEVKEATLSKRFAIKIGTPTQKKIEPKLELLRKPSVFGDDDDDEVEEMPPEAKMRMKNIGRDTQTSSGPNSFGKTRQGFCDTNKVFERQLEKAIDESENS